LTKLKQKREGFQEQWRRDGVSGMALQVLQLMMSQKIAEVEKERQKLENTNIQNKLKTKLQQLQIIEEQVRLRDHIIKEAKMQMNQNNVEYDLTDQKLIDIEEIVNNQKFLPPI
jgi:hypothetical protein